jgi:hypothetical protein
VSSGDKAHYKERNNHVQQVGKNWANAGQEIGLAQGTATFHKNRAPPSFLQKRALFYWSLGSESGLKIDPTLKGI